MDMKILKKALPLGIGSGVLTWAIYALVFEMLINHKPVKEAFFSTGNLIFLAIVSVVESISYYFSLKKKAKEQSSSEEKH